MRTVTVVAIVGVFVLLGAAAFVGLGHFGGTSPSVSLETRWVSDTGMDVSANHHAAAIGTVNGDPTVFAPVSGRRGTEDCGLYAFHANGSRAWKYPVPPENCTIHAVADATTTDYDTDGDVEVLTATTERAVHAFDGQSGDSELRYNLTSYGYTHPVVADLTGDGAREIIVVDAFGTVSVLRPDGSVVWEEQLETFTWGQPSVADFDGDGDPELAVGIGGDGELLLFESDGSIAWRRTDGMKGGVTWMSTGQADDDEPIEIVVATPDGTVIMIDGTDGEQEWRHEFEVFAAVHAFGDGDEDGTPEVYATARDGKLRAIDAPTGEIEWTTTLTTDRVQMMPPPTLGDVDGDGSPDLVAVSNNGIVAVVDPASGEIRGQYERDASIFTHPVTGDLDSDGDDEIIVTYGDGRVVVLDATT